MKRYIFNILGFFKALQDYFQTYRYTIVVPEDFLEEFQSACKCDMAAFFQQWDVTFR